MSMRATENRNTKPAILAGMAMIGIYAVQFVAARFSLREHLTATDLATLRFVGAGMVMLPVVWRIDLADIKVLDWRRALTLAALAGLPYPIIINWGLTYAPATHAAALCPASIVFFSFLLSRALFKERVSPVQITFIAVLITGLVLFISPNGHDRNDTLFGDLVFVGSGVMFSGYAILVRRWAVDSTMATAAVALLSCLPLPVIYLFVPNGLDEAPGSEILTQIVIQGFLAGAAAIFLYTYVVRQLGPQMASLFLPCVPIATAFTAMLVLGESPTILQLFAIVIMSAAMIALALVHQRAERWKARPRDGKLPGFKSSLLQGD